jgi:CHAT domain-containing protein
MKRLAACVMLCASCAHQGADEYYNRAVVALRNGDASKALELTHKAEVRCPREGDCRCKARLLEAEILIRNGQYEAGRTLLSTSIPPGKSFRPLAARLSMLKGALSLNLGELERADFHLHEAEQQALSSGASDVLLDVEIRQAELVFRLRGPAAAEALWRRLLDSTREQRDRFREAVVLNNLGFMILKRDRFDEAIPWLEQAIKAAQKEAVLRLVALGSLNLSICYYRLGMLTEALAAGQQGIKLLGPTGLATYRTKLLGEMGNTYFLAGDPEKAILYYKQALLLTTTNDEKAFWYTNMALANIENKNWEGAEQSNGEALSLSHDPAMLAPLKFIAASVASGRGKYDEASALFKEAIAAAQNSPRLWESHAGLADVYAKVRDYRHANQEYANTLDLIDKSYSALANDSYKLTFLSHVIAFHQRYVKALVDQRSFERALEIADASRARVLFQRLALKGKLGKFSARNYREIAGKLKSTILFYWVAPERSYLWVVKPGSVHPPIELPAAAEIQKLVERYRAFIEKGVRDPIATENEAGRRLYEMLVAPAARLIDRGSLVILVPDGALHWLNFETVPVYPGEGDEKPHYWIEDVRLAIAPSLSVLAGEAEEKPRAPGSVLIIGDPVSPGAEFPKLEYAADEVGRIQKRFPSAQKHVFTGVDAKPEVYAKAEPRRYSLVHFSAHAVANQQSPLDSAIILSKSGDSFKLYARDILSVPLKADLVTLSACRSAGARSYSGEGLVGFAWAFLGSGARNVIAGLWDVTDSSTPGMMDVLYSQMETGKNPAEALREAKLGLIRSNSAYRKPYYWGPFQLYRR